MIQTVLYADGGVRREGVYTVQAEDEAGARAEIERILVPKPHRQAMLAAWRAEGRPVGRGEL
jgi:hypothetical protein